jgi:hypothetical protein
MKTFAVCLVLLTLSVPLSAQNADSIRGVSVSQLGSCSGANVGEFKAVNNLDGASSGVCTSSGGSSGFGSCQCNGSSWIVASMDGGEPSFSGEASFAGKIVNGVQAETCTDSGDGSAGALSLVPTGNVIALTNADADGCDVTMSETGADAGHVVRIVVVASEGTTVNFADSAGVSEIAGAFAAAVQDSISLVYAGATWVELGRSNN